MKTVGLVVWIIICIVAYLIEYSPLIEVIN